jgi:hypothetical protein
MKALSIRQPWADAILAGHGMTNPNVAKRVENRSKRTHFRGRFLIHPATYSIRTAWRS